MQVEIELCDRLHTFKKNCDNNLKYCKKETSTTKMLK